MIVGTVVKQPGEQFPISIDFARRIPTGDAIASAIVTSKNTVTDADTTATLFIGPAGVDGTIVSRECRAGASGEDHVVTFVATLTLFVGRNIEDEILVSVRQQPPP